MHTTTRRMAALAGALTIAVGTVACSTPAPTPAPATAAASSASGDAWSSSATTSDTSTSSRAINVNAPSPAVILDKAKAGALAATSVALKGEVVQDGKKMVIDFRGTDDGSTAEVRLSVEGQGAVHLITLGGAAYMQGDVTFWKAQGAPASVQSAGAKFIKVPAGSESLTQTLNLNNFLDQAFGAVTSSQLSTLVGEETVNGVDCWVLTDKDGKELGALYVAKDAYTLVRFTGSPKSPGTLDFSRWNEDPGVKAPAASEIMALS